MKKSLLMAFTGLATLGLLLSNTYAAAVTHSTPVVNGLNEFAFDLYRQVGQVDKNLILSPYSLSSVMTLLAQGAAGETESQLMQVLHLDEATKEPVIAELATLAKTLKTTAPCGSWMRCKISKASQWIGVGRSSPAFTMANALWADEAFSYKKSFLDSAVKNKSAHFYRMNFSKSPEDARLTINQWVENNTNGRIQDLITKGAITADTKLVLTNAIYFKGLWQLPFKAEETQARPFTLANGNKIDVPMMQQHDKFFYAENDQLQMVQLPYAKSPLAMLILLPKANHSLQEIRQLMNTQAFLQWLQESYKQDVIISLPKFTIQSSFDQLSEAMKALGLTDAFSDKADFSNLTADKLMISDIIQKAMIQVDETGTVAAAATAGLMTTTALMPPVTFEADRPFLFVIFDTESKLLLFMGQVVNPNE